MLLEAAGGVADDPHLRDGALARHMAALNTGALLSEASRRARIAAQVPLDEPPGPSQPSVVAHGYGYGVFIGTIEGHTAYFHPGDNPGVASLSAWLPDHDIAITVLSNDETADIEHVVRRLLRSALGR